MLAEHHITPGVGPMLCGLSGGADSVALILVLKELGYRVMAMHCNFQLRGEESNRDEEFVRDFCAKHGIELQVAHFDTRKEAETHGESIEMAARRLRYEWFEEVLSAVDGGAQGGETQGGGAQGDCVQGGGINSGNAQAGEAHICVAHHADDNVETMLLNLIRGAGLHGLTGMEFCNDWGVMRPLLSVTRAEIVDYLAAKGETFVTDSSNTDTHYRRNKVRHELLPLFREMNPSIDRTLTETMFRLQQAEAAILHPETAEAYRQTQQLLALGFTTAQIEQMTVAENGAFTTAGNTMLTKHRGQLLWGTIPEPVEPTPIEAQRLPRSEVTNLRDASRAVLDVRALKGRLYVRSIREGDRFTPFGMKGTKLVSDYMTDRHRSRLDKLAALVVCDDNGILWLVGETIDQRAAVNETTTEVVVIKNDRIIK